MSMGTGDDENKRFMKRYYLIYYLRVFNRENGEILGHLVDISPGGIMIMRDTPLEVGSPYSLRIRWRNDADQMQVADFEAECRWCRPDVNPDFYAAGFSVLPDRQEYAEVLLDVIRDLAMPDSDLESLG